MARMARVAQKTPARRRSGQRETRPGEAAAAALEVRLVLVEQHHAELGGTRPKPVHRDAARILLQCGDKGLRPIGGGEADQRELALPAVFLRRLARRRAAAEHVLQVAIDVAAVPDRAGRDDAGPGDATRTVVVGGQRQVQVAVVACQQLLQVAGAGIDVLAGLVEMGKQVQPEVARRAGPEYLHHAVGVGMGAGSGVEIALARATASSRVSGSWLTMAA